MNIEEIDAVDVITGLGGICIVAANIAITPLYAIPVGLAWLGFRAVRHSPGMQQWADRVTGGDKLYNKVAGATLPLLLPAPKEDKETEVTINQKQPFDVRVTNVEPSDKLPWAQRVTQPMQVVSSGKLGTATIKTTKKVASNTMDTVLKKMPKYISYEQTPDAPTPTSVLVGYDPVERNWVWIDFGHDGDTIHALVTGQTGAGKDSELRLWYTQLTSNNSPDDIKFVILDGKGEWLTPSLVASPFMFTKPAGGVELVREDGKWVDKANERIENAIGDVFELISERNQEFQKVGATNVSTYQRKTGIKLPLIFIIMTDVGTNIENQVETLVKMLTFKGRSFGIRLIISMQSASGQDTGWRGQLALAMSGFQQIPQADAPNLGIPVRAMVYRPSELPSVDIAVNRGIFVVRKGNKQLLVKAVHLPDEVFEQYCESMIDTQEQAAEVDTFLSELLATPFKKPIVVEQPKPAMTKQQAQKVASLAYNGRNKTDIMIEMGWTSGPVYKEKSQAVDMLIRAARKKLQARNTLEI